MARRYVHQQITEMLFDASASTHTHTRANRRIHCEYVKRQTHTAHTARTHFSHPIFSLIFADLSAIWFHHRPIAAMLSTVSVSNSVFASENFCSLQTTKMARHFETINRSFAKLASKYTVHTLRHLKSCVIDVPPRPAMASSPDGDSVSF